MLVVHSMVSFQVIKTFIKWTIWIVSVVFALVLALLYKFQRKLLYFPQFPVGSREYVSNPREELGLDYELVELESLDGCLLRCFWIPYSSNGAQTVPTVIYFQGNAGNIGHRLPLISMLRNAFPSNAFLLSYRGYGNSEGTPFEQGIKMDAESAFCYVRDKLTHNNSPIVLYGQSLGGAVAAHLLRKYTSDIELVIFENTFLSIRKMVTKVMPFVSPFSWICTELWDTERELEEMLQEHPQKHPFILFMSGLQDEIVPVQHMQQLYQLVRQTSGHCKLRIFKDGFHNTTWDSMGFMEEIAKTFRERNA